MMLSRDRVPAPPAIADAFAQTAVALGRASARDIAGGLTGIGFVLAVVFGVIGLLDLAFGIVDAAAWLALAIGSAIMVVPIAVLLVGHALRARDGRRIAAEALRAQAAAGEAIRNVLDRDARHWFVEHEHGVIMVCPADADGTLYLDLSSVADDVRHDEWYAEGRLNRARWLWFTTLDGTLRAGFAAEGEALPPNSFEAAAGSYDPAVGGDLFEFLASPADGDVIARPFAEVDAFLRARIAGPG